MTDIVFGLSEGLFIGFCVGFLFGFAWAWKRWEERKESEDGK